MSDFRQLLRDLVTEYGGAKQDLARAIGVTPSTLSHLLAERPSIPSTEVCLRLATATGTSPSRVLRAAGKEQIADLIEDLYGAAATRRQMFLGPRLSPHELKHLATVRMLETKTQRAFFLLVEAAASNRRAAVTLPFQESAST